METIVLKETERPRRLLVAFAHPDDESFGPAGTIIHYARQGVAVHLVCATRGEAGDVEPELLAGYSSLAGLRTEELRCAARPLELAALYLLDHRDSGMENTPENQHPDCLLQAPLAEVVEEITGLIRHIQPQVILTHDPSGGYFHPDHIKVHQATRLAFDAAGDPDSFPEQIAQGLAPHQTQKLYYTAFPRRILKIMTKLLPLLGQDPEAFGRNHDVNVKRIAEVDQAVTTKISISKYYEASQRAAHCHRSQNGGSSRRIIDLLGRLTRFDTFSRAFPPWENGSVEKDLFEGLEDEPGPRE